MRLPTVVFRLLLPGVMAGLLLLALAYWWLDNLPHEIFGTALFMLLAWHIVRNRIWFRNMFRGRYDARRVVTLALHLFLILAMVVLLVTSLAISRSVFAFMSMPDGAFLREIHLFAAYWVMILVGIHLGMHWVRVMATARSVLKLSPPNTTRAWSLRAGAILFLLFGVRAWSILDLWSTLTFNYSLEFWDFSASVTPFFGFWAGAIGVPAVLTHYGMIFIRSKRSATSDVTPVAHPPAGVAG